MMAAGRLFFLCLLPLAARAGVGADYVHSPASLDAGGLAGASANYSINACAGPGAAAGSADYGVRTGFAGQLADIVSIGIDEPSAPLSLNEATTFQLGVTAIYDDETKLVLPAGGVTWSVQSGPIAVSSGGLVTAASVYQTTSSIVQAVYGPWSDTVGLKVLNTGLDDFAPYASDGLPDLWQVRYFGEQSQQARPAADGDGDGLSNWMEYAFGMDPAQGMVGLLEWDASTVLRAGPPVLSESVSGGSSTVVAVFARRLDYLAANLTYTVEFSGDLVDWQASASTPTVLAANSEIQVVSVPFPLFLNGKKADFFRVRVKSN